MNLEVDRRKLPSFDELPNFHELTGCAWEVWGKGDQLGTVNLLTNDVVKRAAKDEIKTGQAVSLNWPINFPEKPLFHRRAPDIKSQYLIEGATIRDDEIHLNTQSGTQWDCFKHFPVLNHNTIYGGVNVSDFPIGHISLPGGPENIDPELIKMGVQNWAQHGICGRGVFLDIVEYYTKDGSALPYDPWTTHTISVSVLEDCARAQGVTFRQGDILILRVGFIQKYNKVDKMARDEMAETLTFAGVEQSEEMKRFLWDNHFSAVASDQPAFEALPAPDHWMHETILSLWGMPLGEFFDVEKLSEVCKKTGRYTFFFSSWPLHILGGVASPPNAAAYL